MELGNDWYEGNERYRVCWYSQTGELTSERLSSAPDLALEDFHRGIVGPIEILSRFQSRSELEQAIGPWPLPASDSRRSLNSLRRLAHGCG